MKFTDILYEMVLLEYSKGLINKLTTKYKNEFPSLSNDEILKYIVKFRDMKDSAHVYEKDITKYGWKDLVKIVDEYKPKRIKAGTIKSEPVDANLLYDKDGIRLYVGKTKKACIKYGHGYNFCISSRGENNLYTDYRFIQRGTPFFLFNDNMLPKGNVNELLVILVYSDRRGDVYKYSVTDTDNERETMYNTIDEIIEEYDWVANVRDFLKIYAIEEEEMNEYYKMMLKELNKEFEKEIKNNFGGENVHAFDVNIKFVFDHVYKAEVKGDALANAIKNIDKKGLGERELRAIDRVLDRAKLTYYTTGNPDKVKDHYMKNVKYLFYSQINIEFGGAITEWVKNYADQIYGLFDQFYTIEDVTEYAIKRTNRDTNLLQRFRYVMMLVNKEFTKEKT